MMELTPGGWNMPRRTNRVAVSFVEVLLCVAIIALMLALVAPAITKVREIANKIGCANNLRQLGAAVHSRHADWGCLPPGYYGPVRANGENTKNEISRGPWVGSLVMLMPYLAHEDLYRDLRSTQRSFPLTGQPEPKTVSNWSEIGEESAPWYTDPTNLKLAMKRIPVFECPSDDMYSPVSAGVIVQLYVANDEFAQTTLPGSSGLGRTNYVGIAGAAGDYDQPTGSYLARYAGVLHNRSRKKFRVLTVQDGTSNTVMFGETLGGGMVGGRDTALSWFGAGALGTAYGVGRPQVPHSGLKPPAIGTAPPAGQDGASWYRLSSRHRDGLQFAWCDGSVRSLRFSLVGESTMPTYGVFMTDWALLQQIAGCNDGLNYDRDVCDQ
jgi:prepilin-type processing-associated H-X9-DG protein